MSTPSDSGKVWCEKCYRSFPSRAYYQLHFTSLGICDIEFSEKGKKIHREKMNSEWKTTKKAKNIQAKENGRLIRAKHYYAQKKKEAAQRALKQKELKSRTFKIGDSRNWVYVSDGIFDGNGNLIKGAKSESKTNLKKQEYYSIQPRSKHIARIPRKCSGIHPHCSICGRCFTNRRTHSKGHR